MYQFASAMGEQHHANFPAGQLLELMNLTRYVFGEANLRLHGPLRADSLVASVDGLFVAPGDSLVSPASIWAANARARCLPFDERLLHRRRPVCGA